VCAPGGRRSRTLRAGEWAACGRPVPNLEGLLEVHGLGIRRMPFEAMAVVGLVVDLAAADASRLPEPAAREVQIMQIKLPRLAIAAGTEPLPLVLAYLATAPYPD